MKTLALLFLLTAWAASSGLYAAEPPVDAYLVWTDVSSAPGIATETKVYELSTDKEGLALPPLADRWRLLATVPASADTHPDRPGKQNFYALRGLSVGMHTYAVVAANIVGNSPPSNAANWLLAGSAPAAHTELIIIFKSP